MKITKKQEARILELDPKFFSNDLELGKWYKGNYGQKGIFMYFVSLNEDDNIKCYGVRKDEWYDNRNSELHFGKLSDVEDWIPANFLEVEEALNKIYETKGYKKGNFKCLFTNAISDISVLKHCFSIDDNRFWCKYGVFFEKGIWAEVIKEKELEIGKWYIENHHESYSYFVQYIGNGRANGFFDGKWCEDLLFSNREGIVKIPTNLEIQEQLIQEAKKRGYRTENTKCLLKLKDQEVTGEFCYDGRKDRLFSNGWGKGGKVLFQKGKWAKVLESITFEEAEKILGKKII